MSCFEFLLRELSVLKKMKKKKENIAITIE